MKPPSEARKVNNMNKKTKKKDTVIKSTLRKMNKSFLMGFSANRLVLLPISFKECACYRGMLPTIMVCYVPFNVAEFVVE